MKVVCFSQGAVDQICNRLMWRFFWIQYTKNY